MGYKTRSILSMPIKDNDGEVIGVAQAINKISVKDEPFDEHDEKVRSGTREDTKTQVNVPTDWQTALR